jgi:hypothetical protein
MKSKMSAPETIGLRLVTPTMHQLLVRHPSDEPPSGGTYGYLVVEATRSSFVEACSYLRDTPWLDDHGLASLVLSHFPMSDADIQLLPKRVPWLKALPDIDAQLHALRAALVVPLERRGLPCVDFAEMVVVLANGGEAHLSQASAPSMLLAFDALLSHQAQREWISAANVAMCLHVRSSPRFSLDEFDLIGQRLETFLSDEALVVQSTGPWDGDGVELTLLTVSMRG